MDHLFDHRKYLLLRHERHLDIELVELSGRTVGACILIPETGSDLEIPVESGDHQQLLELLRRLRKRVKGTGMQP